MVHHPAAQYVGMASKKSTNGGHTQGGHVCLAGRAEIVRRVIGGEKQRALARDLGVSRQTIGEWIKRYKAGETLEDRPRTGRPRKSLKPTVLTMIKKIVAEKKPETNAQVIVHLSAATKGRVVLPERTYRDAKRELGIRTLTKRRKLFLTKDHKKKRVQYAKDHGGKTSDDWGMCLFLDEVKGMALPSKRQQCLPGTRPDVAPVFKERTSVMFCGAISGAGKTELYHCPFVPTKTEDNDMRLAKNQADAAKAAAHKKAKAEAITSIDQDVYINSILGKIVLPFVKKNKGSILVHDNAACHGTRSKKGKPSKVSEWLKKNKVNVINLAPCSPDTNPIEKVFSWMKNYVRGRLLRTKEEIVAAYEEAWKAYPMKLFNTQVARLPKILKQIKKDKGSNFNTQ